MGLWLIFQTESLVTKIGLALLQVTFFRYIAWSTISLYEEAALVLANDKMLIASDSVEISILWKHIKAITVRSAFGIKGIFVELFDIDEVVSRPDFIIGKKTSPLFFIVGRLLRLVCRRRQPLGSVRLPSCFDLALSLVHI